MNVISNNYMSISHKSLAFKSGETFFELERNPGWVKKQSLPATNAAHPQSGEVVKSSQSYDIEAAVNHEFAHLTTDEILGNGVQRLECDPQDSGYEVVCKPGSEIHDSGRVNLWDNPENEFAFATKSAVGFIAPEIRLPGQTHWTGASDGDLNMATYCAYRASLILSEMTGKNIRPVDMLDVAKNTAESALLSVPPGAYSNLPQEFYETGTIEKDRLEQIIRQRGIQPLQQLRLPDRFCERFSVNPRVRTNLNKAFDVVQSEQLR